MKKLIFTLLLLISTSTSAWAADTFSPLSVKLTARDTANITRTAEPLTLGVPIPKAANITGTSALRVTASDGSTNIPAQFTVISRWDGLVTDGSKLIRWLQVDFEGDISANSTATFYLKDGGSGTAGSGISRNTTASTFTIDSGTATFTISRTAFNLFNTVDLGSGNILGTTTNDGFIFSDHNLASFYAAKATPLDSSIELDGPLHTIVMVHGTLSTGSATLVGGSGSNNSGTGPGSASGSPQNYRMEYRTRLHFFKDKSFVIVENSLLNDGQGFIRSIVNHIYARSLYLNTTLSLGSSHQITFQGYTNTTSSGTDAYKFSQTHALNSTTNEGSNFTYASTKNGSAAGTNGTRATGYADLGDGSNGLTVAIKDFWQKFPKGFRFLNNVISVDTFPDTGSNYWLRGGWFITDDILYNFHTGTFAASGGANLVAGYQTPVDIRFEPTWFADTQGWGLDAPSTFTMPNADLTDARNRWEQLQRTKYDSTQASNGKSINTYRETRQNITSNLTGNFTSWYGWSAYGDMMWKLVNTGMLTGVQYDWPFSELLQYLRTGNRGFYDLWGASLNHSSDLNIMHGTHLPAGDGTWYAFQEFWEDGGAYATSGSYVGLMSQNQGLCLGYLYTGKKRFLTDCKGMADEGWTLWTAYLHSAPPTFRVEARIYGWVIFKLLNYYKVSGDSTYLTKAMTVFTDGLLNMEQSAPPLGSSGGGYWYDYGVDCASNAVRILMIGYVTEPVTELHRLTGDATVKNFLIRMLDFVKAGPFVGGTTDGSGNYLPYQAPYCYTPSTGAREFRDIMTIYDYFFAGGYAYLYAVTGTTSYRDFARSLFRDSAWYWEAHSNTYINPASKSSIYLGYEPQTAKQQGWTGRFHQGYLSMEYVLNQNGGTLPGWYPGDPTGPSNPSDTTPPVISNISSGTPGDTTATITWTTDEAANSQVEYGLTAGYGSTTTLDSNLVTNHSVAISSLAASTTYHYRVKSADAVANSSTSGDNTFATASSSDYSAAIQISTGNDDCEDKFNGTVNALASNDLNPNGDHIGLRFNNVSIPQGKLITSAYLTVKASAAGGSVHVIIYGETIDNSPAFTSTAGNAIGRTKTTASAAWDTGTWVVGDVINTPSIVSIIQEIVNRPGWVSGNSMTFIIPGTGGGASGFNSFNASPSTAAILHITASSVPWPDTIPPVISNIASQYIFQNDANISWNTDEDSDSQVVYGLTSAYGSASALDSSLVTSHSTTLIGLSPNLTYHFAVRSRDAAGNLSTSSDQTVATIPPPDTALPVNTSPVAFINSGSSVTASTTISLALSATDNVGVTGYFASENPSIPLPDDSGWVSISTTPSYSAAVAFILSTGNAVKTVYVWFKDAAGNVSVVKTSSIILSVPGSPEPGVRTYSSRNYSAGSYADRLYYNRGYVKP